MVAKNMKGTLSTIIAVFVGILPVGGTAGQSTAPDTSAPPTEATDRSASDLQALVAPIALYPDSLVAQPGPFSHISYIEHICSKR